MKRSLALAAACLTGLLVSSVPVDASTATHEHHASSATLDAKVRTISGTVGPGFTISMSRSRTHSGLYTVTIHDRSSAHNFHLTGPGSVDRKTGVAFTGTRTWSVRLRAGTYRYQCDVHPDMMNGTLRVFSG
jgi:plastocyanin